MNQPEKHWYQDGFTVIVVVLLLAGVGVWIREDWNRRAAANRPIVLPLVAGRLEQPFFDNPVLHLTVWHQFPGTLRNGQLTVNIDSPLVAQNDRFQIHSFESWEPNQDHEVSFRIPLTASDLSEEIPIQLRIDSMNGRAVEYTARWLGTGWKNRQTE
ncbi:MAG: hypothetical protein KDA75_00120 [Planctomycetaceae bacterium]|nr:hypothetical protein [Planctomycetaceae bacterium]